MAALTFFCYFKAGILTNERIDSLGVEISQRKGVGELSQQLTASEEYKTAFKYGAYGMTVVTIIIVLIVAALRSRINLAIKVVKRASRALQATPVLVFYPLVTVSLLLCLLAYWIFVAAALASAGRIETADVKDAVEASLDALKNTTGFDNIASFNETAMTAFESIESFDWSRYMLGYHFFGLLWMNQVRIVYKTTTVGQATNCKSPMMWHESASESRLISASSPSAVHAAWFSAAMDVADESARRFVLFTVHSRPWIVGRRHFYQRLVFQPAACRRTSRNWLPPASMHDMRKPWHSTSLLHGITGVRRLVDCYGSVHPSRLGVHGATDEE